MPQATPQRLDALLVRFERIGTVVRALHARKIRIDDPLTNLNGEERGSRPFYYELRNAAGDVVFRGSRFDPTGVTGEFLSVTDRPSSVHDAVPVEPGPLDELIVGHLDSPAADPIEIAGGIAGPVEEPPADAGALPVLIPGAMLPELPQLAPDRRAHKLVRVPTSESPSSFELVLPTTPEPSTLRIYSADMERLLGHPAGEPVFDERVPEATFEPKRYQRRRRPGSSGDDTSMGDK